MQSVLVGFDFDLWFFLSSCHLQNFFTFDWKRKKMSYSLLCIIKSLVYLLVCKFPIRTLTSQSFQTLFLDLKTLNKFIFIQMKEAFLLEKIPNSSSSTWFFVYCLITSLFFAWCLNFIESYFIAERKNSPF